MEISINWKRAEKIFSRLLKMLENKEPPFDRALGPHREENMPSNLKLGGREHALFFFCCCYYMRGGIKSDQAIKSLGRIYEKHSQLFDPLTFSPEVFLTKEQEIIDMLSLEKSLNYGLKDIARFWVKNFYKLATYWEGNPINLFQGISNYEELCAVIQNRDRFKLHQPNGFYGFQEKMVSMLAFFLADTDIIPTFSFPVPVDFHVLRMVVSQNLLKIKNGSDVIDFRNPQILATIRQMSEDYCRKHNVDARRLSDVLWLYSGAMCNNSPGNTVSHGDYRARLTKLERKGEKNWSKTDNKNYYRYCGQCQIQDTCKYDVPSGYYYVQGRLTRKPKHTPLQLTLFSNQ